LHSPNCFTIQVAYQANSEFPDTKIQTAAQVKQLQYLKPILCHWAGDGPQHASCATSSSLGNNIHRANYIQQHLLQRQMMQEGNERLLISKHTSGSLTNHILQLIGCW
jgi:hypothetical protein